MSKLSRAEQARINGSKSKGPITEEGKKRSARNAVRHGILAKTICLTIEDQADYDCILKSFIKRFQPADDVELRLVEQMAGCSFRLERCHVAETALFDNEMDLQRPKIRKEYTKIDPITEFALAFKSLADNSKSLQLYMRYEASIIRQFQNLYKQLKEIKAQMPPPEPDAETQAEPVEAAAVPQAESQEHNGAQPNIYIHRENELPNTEELTPISPETVP